MLLFCCSGWIPFSVDGCCSRSSHRLHGPTFSKRGWYWPPGRGCLECPYFYGVICFILCFLYSDFIAIHYICIICYWFGFGVQWGRTALMVSAHHESIDCVALLLDRGASIDLQDKVVLHAFMQLCFVAFQARIFIDCPAGRQIGTLAVCCDQ